MKQAGRAIRRTLDAVYLTGGIVGAVFLVAVLVLIVLQMVARWTGHVFPGATDYAGYCMAGASFMAFAYALHQGAHIRVELVLALLGRYRRWGDAACFAVGAVIATYVARYAIKMTYWTWKLGDVSQGQDATELWIPQIVTVIGSVMLALCFWDNFFRLLLGGQPGARVLLADPSHAE